MLVGFVGFFFRPKVTAYNPNIDSISKYPIFLNKAVYVHVILTHSLMDGGRGTTDSFVELKECSIYNDNYLVTLDVSSLNTNISHENIINA